MRASLPFFLPLALGAWVEPNAQKPHRTGTETGHSGDFVNDADDPSMLMSGGVHAASITTDVRQLSKNADPLTWTSASPSTPYEAMTQARRLVMLPSVNYLILYIQGYPADVPSHLSAGGDVAEHDPSTQTWATQTDTLPLGTILFHTIQYDPVNDVLSFSPTGRTGSQPAPTGYKTRRCRLAILGRPTVGGRGSARLRTPPGGRRPSLAAHNNQ